MSINKTKIVFSTVFILILFVLFINSTAWFRLRLAEHYKNTGQKGKATQMYEKVLRKVELETGNPLVFSNELDDEQKYKLNKYLADYYYKAGDIEKAISHYKTLQELKPDREEDYFYLYYLTKQEEKLADFILSNGNLKNKIPKAHFKTPLWKFYLARSLAKKKRWQESEAILEELVRKYPYLNTFKSSIEDIRNGQVFKQSFPIIGMWKFNEGKGDILKDSSGMKNDGEIKGAKWVKELDGYALSFDGEDDTVIIPDNKSMHLDGEDFTIAMWIKPLPQKKNRFVYHKWRPNLYLLQDNKTWLFAVQDSSGNKFLNIKYPIKEKWYFVVQRVKQGEEHKIWLFDTNELIESANRKDVGITKGSNGKNFKLSRKGWHSEDNAWFRGDVGKVYLFSVAINYKEIKKLYDFSKGGR